VGEGMGRHGASALPVLPRALFEAVEVCEEIAGEHEFGIAFGGEEVAYVGEQRGDGGVIVTDIGGKDVSYGGADPFGPGIADEIGNVNQRLDTVLLVRREAGGHSDRRVLGMGAKVFTVLLSPEFQTIHYLLRDIGGRFPAETLDGSEGLLRSKLMGMQRLASEGGIGPCPAKALGTKQRWSVTPSSPSGCR